MKTKTLLNVRQTFLEIRLRFKKAVEGRANLPISGMCRETQVLYYGGKISKDTLHAVMGHIDGLRPRESSTFFVYYWPRNLAGAKERVKAITKVLKKLK